ncbi:hypothetical protein SCLCIDRAFT_1224733 [Scleroderma citrinum Foug A]|uniref:Uncharacterized protein n=1 Tax=Scleroderma citrinum Foug A TaxID=1036808 RepID=A0A0C2ZE45_9AGAM|nr:hypothetical protein SCLCIDRAFT_1224733 [Scleroderma citrinum Foug A]
MIRKKTLRQGDPFLLVEHGIIRNSQHAIHLERGSICGYGLQEVSSQADSWCNVQIQGGEKLSMFSDLIHKETALAGKSVRQWLI